MATETPAAENIKPKKRSSRRQRTRHAPPGTAPGSLNVPEGALRPRVKIISYDQTTFQEKEVNGVQAIKEQIDRFPAMIHWIDIRGFGDKSFFEQVADCFGIHRLQ